MVFRIEVVIYLVNVSFSLPNIFILCPRDSFDSHFLKLLGNKRVFRLDRRMKLLEVVSLYVGIQNTTCRKQTKLRRNQWCYETTQIIAMNYCTWESCTLIINWYYFYQDFSIHHIYRTVFLLSESFFDQYVSFPTLFCYWLRITNVFLAKCIIFWIQS